MKTKKQILFGLGVTGALVLILALIKLFQISAAIAQAAKQGPPPEAVTSYVAKKEVWPRTFSAVGSLKAVQGATLGAEETGRVAKVSFESGSKVEAGQLLLELDTSVEQAQLNGVRAQLELAQITAQRQRALRKRGANSQSDLDTAEANLRDLEAESARLQALIERKQIIAPFAGQVGIRQVNVGDMVAQGDRIITIHAYEKLFVDFDLPQRVLGKLKSGDRVELAIDAFPGQKFEAAVTAIESQVNPKTRNIAIQGTLENPQGALRPGMFASVTAYLDESDEVLSVPASSISYAPYGNSVWVISPEEQAGVPRPARAQFVQIGRRLGDRVAIVSGLTPGLEIVSSGIFKMRPGVMVFVNNQVEPGNELNPDPQDT